MGIQKGIKTRKSYDVDFKQEEARKKSLRRLELSKNGSISIVHLNSVVINTQNGRN